MPDTPLILASASPRRADLLTAAAIPFEVVTTDLDESILAGEQPHAYVERLAAAKARLVAARHPGRLVLGADTTVVLDDRILAKPQDPGDARRMLQALSGRIHTVLTGVCLVVPGALGPAPAGQGAPEEGPAHVRTQVASTEVEFAELSAADVDWYVASGEPMDKAGAYAIQGLGSRFVTRLNGSYSNVVGLPVALVWRMLQAGAPAAGGRVLRAQP